MSGSSDYIPAEDAQFRTSANNFARRISAQPDLYMISPAEAASIQAAVDGFDAAYVAANDETTRTTPVVIAKENARSVAETMIRQYAMIIKNNLGVSDEDKAAIGVRPINPSREPIECPQTSPLLNILAATPGSQTLRYADTNTPDSKARPFGAAALQLFLAVGEGEVVPLTEARLCGTFTRNPIGVTFEHADNAKNATYYARWVSAKGQTGPWSLPVSMRIAA